MEKQDGIEYQIGLGSDADVLAIARFQADMAMESEGMVLDYERVLKGVSAAMADEHKGRYIVAKVEGLLIGSLMLTREWSDWTNRWYWWIQSVYVKPEYRRKGAYSAMYAKIKELAREQDVAQVRLYVDKTNYPAQKVYQKLGMQECHYYMYEELV